MYLSMVSIASLSFMGLILRGSGVELEGELEELALVTVLQGKLRLDGCLARWSMATLRLGSLDGCVWTDAGL